MQQASIVSLFKTIWHSVVSDIKTWKSDRAKAREWPSRRCHYCEAGFTDDEFCYMAEGGYYHRSCYYKHKYIP